MNAVGRQMQRSPAPAPAPAHHQRQYTDHFLDAASNNRWLQSAAPPSQDYSRMYRSAQRSGELFSEPSTPPVFSRSSSQRKNGDDYISPSELSPGILDLHSFDTELLPDMPVPGLFEGTFNYHSARGRSFDDSDPGFSTVRQTGKPRGLSENNLLKSFSADREKTGSVAKIKVVVRKRPLNKKEISKKEEDIITIVPSASSLTVHETKFKVDLTEYVEKHEFVFDAVLNQNVSNDEVYRETVAPIVPLIFQRIKATCFAYGQTGSGKTYTMQPLPLKASQDILMLMHHTYRNQGFQLFVSFFEIYGGKLFDLLNDRRKLCMREDGKQQVCIVGLQEYRVSSVETIREFIEKGNATRSTGTTGANEESSRSHAILQLAIKRSVDGSESKPPRIFGKLSFIDLAGSERGADTTDNDKQTRMEGAEINKSLLALKECIRALDNDQGHIPFRGSKLTEVLRDSFVGDSRTVMISCISPNSCSCEHTLNTLRYADRVKSLSKGNNSKKDPLSSTLNFRDSTALPLSKVLSVNGNSVDMSNETNRFGWSKQPQMETSLPPSMKNKFSGGDDGQLGSVYLNYSREQQVGRGYATGEELDFPDESYGQDKQPGRKGKPMMHRVSATESNTRKSEAQLKWKELPDSDANGFNADNNLNALLKEEEDLVVAHRKQVEETIDIVREEMKLLIEADHPGNHLDEYIFRLHTILSQKAAGIVNLQNRLAHFHRLLNEHNVLVSSLSQ
ncbi:kinesin-like protein KIN-13B isoform X2 [Aristolochia californica]|uniref:kinesin-like protein KIN-13B isoform X2 n=1 Tax=Aristolochia californica TaxID=171875 RepID=UPI0035DF5D88